MKSYTGTSHITYVKQQQQEHQIRPSSIKKKNIFFVDMACPNESNVHAKHEEKLQKYEQLALEIRETTRAQRSDNSNRYWLLTWRHETSGKPNWTTSIKQEENKSDIERNGEGSTIWKWKYNKESAIRTNTRRLMQIDLLGLQLKMGYHVLLVKMTFFVRKESTIPKYSFTLIPQCSSFLWKGASSVCISWYIPIVFWYRAC